MKLNYRLDIKQTGYGHWRITTVHYNKEISCITTNSKAIDAYNSGDYSPKSRVNSGYRELRNEIIRKNKPN
jgi:hypothetical protein